MAAKKVSKQTKNFTKKHLPHTLASRKKHQLKKKQSENRQHLRAIKRKNHQSGNDTSGKSNKPISGSDDDNDDDDDSITQTRPMMDMSVDALLNAEGLDFENDESEDGNSNDSEEDDDDLESISSLDDEPNGKMDFKVLKEKDPEFYKFLQENDKGLLQFDEDNLDEEAEDDDDETTEQGVGRTKHQDEHSQSTDSILLTKELLRTWQKAILEKRSMRALRKVLLAFKSAAFSSSSNSANLPYTIESSSVFNALVITTLRYLPVFFHQTLPAKELPSGKFKITTNSNMYASVQRLLKSYFTSLIELIAQFPSQSKDDSLNEGGMLHIAISQTAKLTPWITGNRKLMKAWIKTLLDLWSSSSDPVRMAAVLSLRRLAVAADISMMISIMKGIYTHLVRSAKSTTVFTLPLINLMKNSGSGIFLINLEASYQIIFNFIRQLAIHLRNSMKLKTKEGFQAVYNWQYIHSLDFWSLVLSSACEKSSTSSECQTSPLQPLIYPLVQITIGVIKLIPTSRYYPLRFHCLRILLRIIQRTGTFIPLTPFLLDTFDSPLFKRTPNPTSLKPLNWEYILRCPKSYENSRVYSEGAGEEAIYLLLEYHTTLSKSIGFPELVLPTLVILKRLSKGFTHQHPKLVKQIKTLIEKFENNKVWIENHRSKDLSMTNFRAKDSKSRAFEFLNEIELSKTPLSCHLRLQSKIRSQKQSVLDRSAHNNDIQIDED